MTPYAQLGNSYYKLKNSPLKISYYLVIRASTRAWKPLTDQVTILTLDTGYLGMQFSFSLISFVQESLKKIIVFIPLQKNFQTSKIFMDGKTLSHPALLPVDEDRLKTLLMEIIQLFEEHRSLSSDKSTTRVVYKTETGQEQKPFLTSE